MFINFCSTKSIERYYCTTHQENSIANRLVHIRHPYHLPFAAWSSFRPSSASSCCPSMRSTPHRRTVHARPPLRGNICHSGSTCNTGSTTRHRWIAARSFRRTRSPPSRCRRRSSRTCGRRAWAASQGPVHGDRARAGGSRPTRSPPWSSRTRPRRGVCPRRPCRCAACRRPDLWVDGWRHCPASVPRVLLQQYSTMLNNNKIIS